MLEQLFKYYLAHPGEDRRKLAETYQENRPAPRRVRLSRRHDRPLRHAGKRAHLRQETQQSCDRFVGRQTGQQFAPPFSPAPAKPNPARFRSKAASTNRRRCARGCGRINSGELRVSVPNAIKSKSSGRGSFRTFLGGGRIPFPVRAVFSATIRGVSFSSGIKPTTAFTNFGEPGGQSTGDGLPEGRFQNWLVGKVSQPRHRVQNDLPRIAEIRTECNEGKFLSF